MKKHLSFTGLLQNQKWISPVYISLDERGQIESISDTSDQNIIYEHTDGFAIPGLVNAHSHAFQYAMSGLAELHNLKNNPDDFWSWREQMYKVALHIDPDQMEDIAAMLYAEMLRNGYTHVVEFHYVHHDKNGEPYNNIGEMGSRLISAAKTAGIKITLIPILYQKGGFGQEPNKGQRRFICPAMDDYLNLVASSREASKYYDFATVSCGVHSLRAIEPSQLNTIFSEISSTTPFHLHIAEQRKEVEDSIAYLSKRPVTWLLDNIDVTAQFHLIHATHMTEEETKALALSGAQVVLCPSTEGNLGDGIFNLKTFQKFGGSWCIGTDSQIGLNPFEDLRVLDYGQRTKSHSRTSFVTEHNGDSGSQALGQMISSGRKAAGLPEEAYFEKGAYFDAIIIDANHPLIGSSSLTYLCSTIVYASDTSMMLGTIINGEWVVKNSNHKDRNQILDLFLKTMKDLDIRNQIII